MYLITITFAKFLNLIIGLLRLGTGSTWPGHFALKVFPKIWLHVTARLPSRVVFVSGTNGKTTTCKLITHMLQSSGKHVVANASGANLLNGILTSYILSTDLWGNLKTDAVVFEVDELTLPKLLSYMKPSVLALLNLSRDQLDRYWETDLIYERWEKSILSCPEVFVLILDNMQKEFKSLASNYKGKTLFFNDAPGGLLQTKLMGSYNAKNINCALLTAAELSLSSEDALKCLPDFTHAFGRGESIDYKGKNYQLYLAKNPASLNENLKTLASANPAPSTLVYVLNDKVPDGHDISWIYDVDQTLLRDFCKGKYIFVSGTRAYDMAIRLMYADVEISEGNVIESVHQVLDKVTHDPQTKGVIILPNYSAMLETRKIILGRNIL